MPNKRVEEPSQTAASLLNKGPVVGQMVSVDYILLASFAVAITK